MLVIERKMVLGRVRLVRPQIFVPRESANRKNGVGVAKRSRGFYNHAMRLKSCGRVKGESGALTTESMTMVTLATISPFNFCDFLHYSRRSKKVPAGRPKSAEDTELMSSSGESTKRLRKCKRLSEER